MSITPSHGRICFALDLQWSLNGSIEKKSNAICIFANLFFALVCGSDFLQLGSAFCRNAQKEEKKS